MSYGFVTAAAGVSGLPSPKCHVYVKLSADPTALGTVAPSTIVVSRDPVTGYVVWGLVGFVGIHGTVRTVTGGGKAIATWVRAKAEIATIPILAKDLAFI